MKILAVLVMLLTLSACGLPVFFRVPVVQGNVVTGKEVSQLKLGMTKKQVQYVMGTPLVHPSYETDRWDYVFYYRNPRANVRQSQLNLYFADGKLDHIGGNREYTDEILNPVDNSNGQIAPLPGSVGTPGVVPGVEQQGAIPANDSDQIPRSTSQRPNTSDDQIPGSDIPGADRPLPKTAAPPLPGLGG